MKLSNYLAVFAVSCLMITGSSRAGTCPTKPPNPVGAAWASSNGCRTRCVVGEPLKFWASYDPPSAQQSCDRMRWSFGDGTPDVDGTVGHVWHRFPSVGPYHVTLTVSNTFGADTSAVDVKFVEKCPIVPPPQAEFTYIGGLSRCQSNGRDDPCYRGESISFAAQAWDGELDTCTSVLWDFGDGSASWSRAVSHSFELPGTYTVRETIANPMGSSTAAKTIVIAPICEKPVILQAPANPPGFAYYILRNTPVTIRFRVYAASPPLICDWYRDGKYFGRTSIPEVQLGDVTVPTVFVVYISDQCGAGATNAVVSVIPLDALPKGRPVRH